MHSNKMQQHYDCKSYDDLLYNMHRKIVHALLSYCQATYFMYEPSIQGRRLLGPF